jgi:hypothetical protein
MTTQNVLTLRLHHDPQDKEKTESIKTTKLKMLQVRCNWASSRISLEIGKLRIPRESATQQN